MGGNQMWDYNQEVRLERVLCRVPGVTYCNLSLAGPDARSREHRPLSDQGQSGQRCYIAAIERVRRPPIAKVAFGK